MAISVFTHSSLNILHVFLGSFFCYCLFDAPLCELDGQGPVGMDMTQLKVYCGHWGSTEDHAL